IRILTKSLIGSFDRPLQNQTTQLIQLVLHISLQPLERHTPLHAIQNHLRKAQELRPHLLNQIYHGRPHLLSTSVLVRCQDGEVFFRFLPLPTLSYSNVTLSPGRSESRFHQLFQDQDARLAACRRGLSPDSESRWSCRSVLAGSLHRPARQRRAQRCWLGPLSCSIQRRRWLLVTSLHFCALWPWCGFCSTCTSGWSPLGDRKSVVE